MQPNPRPSRAPGTPRPSSAGISPGPGRPSADTAPTDDFAAATALWCPHCKTPFIGAISLADASFVHAACGGRSVLDMDLLDALAAESWFWQRYRDRLRGHGGTA